MGAGRDALVLGTEVSDGGGKVRAGAIRWQLADELPAIIGLPSQVAEGDAAACEVRWDTLCEQGAGLGGALRGEGQELQVLVDLGDGGC